MPTLIKKPLSRHLSHDWLEKSIKTRRAIKKNISPADKLKLLNGMLLTRAVDNALKHLFLSGEIIYKNKGFQGKGFRSLGQEAIFGAALKLNTGSQFRDKDGYFGDVAAPLIRDLGVFLAFSDGDVETAINAQAGKSGLPCDGRDLHMGNMTQGLLMPAAPLAIATCSLLGVAMAFKLKKEARVAVSFIGEGGSSLGEWHEAINFAAVNELPLIFCIENNQTALSTPVSAQSRVKTFADKAVGYGINALCVDGNDIEEVAAAFKFAADEARLGLGPILIELLTMRMCGHAHHDDMLYLGHDPKLTFELPKASSGGYVNFGLYEKWRKRDPIALYKRKLEREKVLHEEDFHHTCAQILSRVQAAVDRIKERPWPTLTGTDADLVFKKPLHFRAPQTYVSSNYRFDPKGATYLQAIAEGTRRSLLKHKNSLVIGEDVGAPYGNAFMMFKPLMPEHSARFFNTPISENAIVGACVGLSLSGMRPIGEMQFNDFVACAMNQVVNNVAKNYFRTGLSLPMVLRMPYGGLRRAGPFHSQDTSPWFYRSFGLKIFAPSTPIDALHMLMQAVDDPDPVLFYEHIALYRDPNIKQVLPTSAEPGDFAGAVLVKEGQDLTVISYGAYVHVAKKIAETLQIKHNKSVEVIDLRYLMPVDFATCYESVRKCNRALLVGEDARTGSILESIGSKISQDCFRDLDAPVKVLGSRDLPVPYSPSLEDDYLLSEDQIMQAAFELLTY